MKLAFILPHFDEANNSFSRLLAPVCTALISQGHEVSIFSANSKYRGPFREAHKTLPRAWLFFPFIAGFIVWRHHLTQRFDIVHNLGCGTSFFHNVITAHACHRAYVGRKWQYREWARLIFNPAHLVTTLVESYNYRRNNSMVIAVSQSVAKELRLFHSRVTERLFKVENGVDNWQPSCKVIGSTRRYPQKTDFVIVFASNNHHHKGLRPLLKAMARASQVGLPWKLRIYGDDPSEYRFRKLVLDWGISEVVKFYGHTPHLVEAMADCDVLCLPSKYESFGLVFLDALAAGIPIVATPVGIYQNLVGTMGDDIQLNHPVSDIQVFNSLKRIADEPEFALKLVDTGRQYARRFSSEKMVAATLKVYDLAVAKFPLK